MAEDVCIAFTGSLARWSTVFLAVRAAVCPGGDGGIATPRALKGTIEMKEEVVIAIKYE